MAAVAAFTAAFSRLGAAANHGGGYKVLRAASMQYCSGLNLGPIRRDAGKNDVRRQREEAVRLHHLDLVSCRSSMSYSAGCGRH